MSNCELLCNLFENKEAIFIDKGAIRVRVFNIQSNLDERTIIADIEEIPTIGLGVGSFPTRESLEVEMLPLSWNISVGYKTTFSNNVWTMGYGGWVLNFNTKVIEGIVAISSDWSDTLCDSGLRYEFIQEWLKENSSDEAPQRVFLNE